MGNLSTPIIVPKLQKALHAKAKAEPSFRFHALYDKMYREDILAYAYAQCRSNKGAPGVDGQDFADVEAYGRERWLGELALALSEETYRPEPIFGADLPPEQYAYRPGRNAQQAVVEVEEVLFRSHPDVVDADLADYFGSIPHAEVLKSMALRVVDRRVLHLIKQWLECSVEETDGRGRKRPTTVAKDIRRCVLVMSRSTRSLTVGYAGPVGQSLERSSVDLNVIINFLHGNWPTLGRRG